MNLSKQLHRVFIPALIPYFLEKGRLWLQEHEQEVLEAQQTQPFFQDNLLVIEQAQVLSLSAFLRRLDELGYEKVQQTEQLGEFSNRGNLVEVFPLSLAHAIRIEFTGNVIETIEPFSLAIEDEFSAKEFLKKRLKNQLLFSDLKSLKEGDYIVHLDHGVAVYKGPSFAVAKDGPLQKYYILEYAAGDKLWIPAGLERKLSRYVGFTAPKISRLGSVLWQKTKRKVKEEAEKIAKELLQIYAQKEIALRPPYEKESEIEKELKASFPYQETPDQIQALRDIEEDLQKEIPMDRLVCGDVGFGKTEIALRTMVRAVSNGYQTALLCPTTILAHQHFQNFTERVSRLPIKIALLSRLQSKKEQTRIVGALRRGELDIVIGTHRLLSQDVSFNKLGLLVIDDEQRFGVKQKERLRNVRASLDVLSLSATPIPRTLEMALSSLKKISLVQTPPMGRKAPRMVVALRTNRIIKEAMEKELRREGQIYYLHNRIGTIGLVKKLLETLLPGVRCALIHAKISEKQLIDTMEKFRNQKFSLLIATTLIQNGLDIPTVNTIIIEDVTLLGLGEAYQLRGRVGRSQEEPFVYFLHGKKLGEKAKMRLEALKESAALGSGYRIALRDMKIRGAGNILGKEQSGAVNAVGLNLYCQMLSLAVEHLRGTPK